MEYTSTRGSQWNRWDLHVHTPNTKKNDQFAGGSIDEKWDLFYKNISDYIGDGTNCNKSIVAIGITDYLSVDNYKKIIENDKLPSSVKLVLPNIEMRIQPHSSSSPVNIHFLFNPDFVNQIENRFFSQIKFPYENTTYNASKCDLIRLGKYCNSTLLDDDAYKKGIEQFVVSFDAIKNVFDKDRDLRENVLIGVSNNSADGVSGVVEHSGYLESNDSQLKTFRQSLYKFVDFIFSAKPSDINFFLGKKSSCPKELVIKDCGSLKPCLHGCDAHEANKIFEPDLNRYC